MIDNQGIGLSIWKEFGFSALSQKQFDKGYGLELFLRMNRATGATMAMRRVFLSNVNFSSVDKYFLHDSMLAYAALAKHALGYISKPLIRYRLHEKNVIGCVIVETRHRSWYDARYPGLIWTNDIWNYKWDENDRHRMMFFEKRNSIIGKLFAYTMPLAVGDYFACYGKNCLCFMWYDYCLAFKRSVRYVWSYFCKKN